MKLWTWNFSVKEYSLYWAKKILQVATDSEGIIDFGREDHYIVVSFFPSRFEIIHPWKQITLVFKLKSLLSQDFLSYFST